MGVGRSPYKAFKEAVSHYPSVYTNSRVVLNFARYLTRRPHERDFAYFKTAHNPGLILDIGANNGMSALSIRMFDRTSPILSIEPSILVERDLRIIKKLVPRFDYRIMAAGDKNGEFTLFTPCYRGTPITGYASLLPRPAADVGWIDEHVRRLQPGDYSVHEQRVAVVPLDQLDLAPSFIKIDVEGSELKVLTGLRRTLERHRPTLLIERSPGFDVVQDYLAELDYRPHSYSAEVAGLVPWEDSPSPNVFFAIR